MSEVERFVALLAEHDVVRFGAFTLKSGRQSPYFINTGQLRTGRAISELGEAYASVISANRLRCDFVFGPSYKGVPLAVATSIALSTQGEDVGFCFDRKEAKDHGEGGRFVGTQPTAGSHAVVVDDVITSGASIRDSVELLRAQSVEVSATIIAVDRQEHGSGARSTLEELEETLGIPVFPVVRIGEMIDILHRRGEVSDELRASIESYLRRYGSSTGAQAGAPER